MDLGNGHVAKIGASIGIAVGSFDTEDADKLIRQSDIAMYSAKRSGGGCSYYEPGMGDPTSAREAQIAELTRAIRDGELFTVYQPLINLRTGRPTGAEALVRWQHPEDGVVGPDAFIGLAEETGLIVEIGAQVLREACRQAARWAAADASQPLTITVNLSARQLSDPAIVGTVTEALADAGLDPKRLVLEITETVLMQDREAAAATLWQLKALGIRIAIDDFGTGYSSLAYLRRFPIDMLKIAREFVDGLGRDEHDDVITRAIVELAGTLGLLTVAEGIETHDQQTIVTALGCDLGQGYLFSVPVDAEAAFAVLTAAPLAVPHPRPGEGRSAALQRRLTRLRLSRAAPARRPRSGVPARGTRATTRPPRSPAARGRPPSPASCHSPTSLGSGAGRPGEPAQVDRADLVLHDAAELRPVAVTGQGRPDVGDPQAELERGAPGDRGGVVLVRAGMAAHRVGPHARERRLVLGPPGDQQAAGVVEEVGGEGPVQRRLAVVHLRLGQRADRRPVVVDQDDQLLHRRHDGTRASGGRHDRVGGGQLPTRRPDLRRPRRRTAGRRARRPPARLPAGLAAWDAVSPRCTSTACAPSHPTSGATPPWPGRAGGSTTRCARRRPTSWRSWTPPGWRARTSSGHDWGGMVAWALGAWHPDRLRTLTVLSVPHPAAMAKAMVTSDQALRSYYMGRVPAAAPARAPAAGPGRQGPARHAAQRRPLARGRRRTTSPGCRSRARSPRRWAGTARCPSARATGSAPSGCRRCTCGAPGDAFLGRAGIEATAQFVDAPYRLEILDDVSHWIPELAADRVAELITAHVRTA